MSLRHALLGFLNYGPMTGYELKKSFDVSIAHFWNAELSQIYPTLKQLEAEGLVEMEVRVQTERPNRKVYSISEDGRRELIDWLASANRTDPVREALLIKVFLGAAVPKDTLVGVLRQRIDEIRRTLEEHRPAPDHAKQLAEAAGLPGDALFWSLATDAYLRRLEVDIAWLEETIRKLEQADGSLVTARRRKSRGADGRKTLQILETLVPDHLARIGGDGPASPRKEERQ